MGVQTRGPVRRIMGAGMPGVFHELEIAADGTITQIGVYTALELGIIYLVSRAPDLSPDGLRVMFVGQGSSSIVTLYSERPTLAARFGPPVVMPDVPPDTEPFMTGDCGRIYVRALGTIFYAPQL